MNREKKIGILLLHGFAGSRDEVRPLYECLQGENYLIEMPCLTGHEGEKAKLAKAHYEDWILDAETSYLRLSEKCEKIMIVGFSMGGLLAVNLCHYNPTALITINTPIYYWNPKIIVENLYREPRTYLKKYVSASLSKPITALTQFQKLLTKTKPIFQKVECNALVIQALDDDTVHCKSADDIYHHLRGNKEIYKLNHGGHIIFQSENSEEVCSTIKLYLNQMVS